MVICPQCGAPNNSSSRFCAQCGAPLNPVAPPAPVKSRSGVWAWISGGVLIVSLILGLLVWLGGGDSAPAVEPQSGKSDSTPAAAQSGPFWVEDGVRLVENGKVRFEDPDGIYDPQRSPGGRYVIYSTGGDKLYFHDTREPKKRSLLYQLSGDGPDQAFPVGFSPDGKEVAVLAVSSSGFSGGNQLLIIGLDGKLKTSLAKGVRYASWTSDGGFVISLGSELRIIDRQGKTVKTLTNPGFAAYISMENPVLWPDGSKVLFHVGEKYYVQEINAAEARKLFTVSLSMAGRAAVAADGKILAVDDGGVYLFDPSTGKSEQLSEVGDPSYPGF